MPILTTKELQALSDQLDFEKVLHLQVPVCRPGVPGRRPEGKAPEHGGPAPPELHHPAGLPEVRRGPI